MLAAQSDKALLHVYNFQKVRISRIPQGPSANNRTGSDCPKDGFAGKANLSGTRSKGKILCLWYRSGTDISLGGAFPFIFSRMP